MTFTGEKTSVVKVRAAYTSQTCHQCGNKGDRVTRDDFVCPTCNLTLDADLNAAENVSTLGKRGLAETAANGRTRNQRQASVAVNKAASKEAT